jgi:hypothetical protein
MPFLSGFLQAARRTSIPSSASLCISERTAVLTPLPRIWTLLHTIKIFIFVNLNLKEQQSEIKKLSNPYKILQTDIKKDKLQAVSNKTIIFA